MFQLIETMRWTPGEGYFLLDLHLDRLARSASHFGFVCDQAGVRRALEDEAAGYDDGPRRVRLLLHPDGHIALSADRFDPPSADAVARYAVSERQVDSGDVFLRHKTTRRAMYDAEYRRFQRETACDDVLFTNERGEITEGSRTNIFVQIAGPLLTPPLESGLLDGTLRRYLLQSEQAREAVLTPGDLAAAERVFLGNSVRGLLRATPVR